MWWDNLARGRIFKMREWEGKWANCRKRRERRAEWLCAKDTVRQIVDLVGWLGGMVISCRNSHHTAVLDTIPTKATYLYITRPASCVTCSIRSDPRDINHTRHYLA